MVCYCYSATVRDSHFIYLKSSLFLLLLALYTRVQHLYQTDRAETHLRWNAQVIGGHNIKLLWE